MQALGYLCWGFGALDFGLYQFGVMDLTGVSWSPIAAAVLGSVLIKAGSSDSEDQPNVAAE